MARTADNAAEATRNVFAALADLQTAYLEVGRWVDVSDLNVNQRSAIRMEVLRVASMRDGMHRIATYG
ncbi:MAG: hypothetical protein DRQ55_16120 [Planctomycetota bacterium]|nr:MAG: hypothetical protein DRQ55_16120 [Planctomycetota bacterium]